MPGEEEAPVTAEDARQAALNRITQAQQVLANPADSDAETAARDELMAALGEYFDRDMELRVSELETIRTGLASLEAKIEERAAARDDIIALQLEISVNDADGLGFFSSGNYGQPQWNPGIAPAPTVSR
jgi:hypothetical protein